MPIIHPKPELIYIAETSSTNSYLKGLEGKDNLPEGSLVYTDFQQAGRGQRGNSWESERGGNLLFSLIIHPLHIDLSTHFIISQTIALAVVQTLDQYREGFTIKWPNDIYYGDKKIGGILIENELKDDCIVNSVIGVGLNINQTVFKSDAPNPISLKIIIGCDVDRYALLKQIQENFTSLYSPLEIIDYLYKSRLYRKNGYHKYKDAQGSEFEAKINDVEKNGLLVLELKNFQIKKYAFKEVKYIL